MSGWILSVVSVVVLMVLLDIFMAEGETKKYIKGIMSIIVIAVIIAPLPGILKKDIRISEAFQNNAEYHSIETDSDYLYRLYIAQYAEKEKKIERGLEEKGIKNSNVRINIYQYNGRIELINVLVSLEKSVITGIDKNININEMIYEQVCKVVDAPREQVIIYGKSV